MLSFYHQFFLIVAFLWVVFVSVINLVIKFPVIIVYQIYFLNFLAHLAALVDTETTLAHPLLQ
jgi:hypothetical protein